MVTSVKLNAYCTTELVAYEIIFNSQQQTIYLQLLLEIITHLFLEATSDEAPII